MVSKRATWRSSIWHLSHSSHLVTCTKAPRSLPAHNNSTYADLFILMGFFLAFFFFFLSHQKMCCFTKGLPLRIAINVFNILTFYRHGRLLVRKVGWFPAEPNMFSKMGTICFKCCFFSLSPDLAPGYLAISVPEARSAEGAPAPPPPSLVPLMDGGLACTTYAQGRLCLPINQTSDTISPPPKKTWLNFHQESYLFMLNIGQSSHWNQSVVGRSKLTVVNHWAHRCENNKVPTVVFSS